jgi:dTDP-4-amino-4,6-dideoxygalactose transaminase
MNAYQVVRDFEQALCDYTGAPYAVTVDNCSNALFLALMFVGVKDKVVTIPKHTYMSVPCSIIHAGGWVKFVDSPPELTGAYPLYPTAVIDSALRFTADMYVGASLMCLSFTGPYKHLKLGKGGAILTDNEAAYKWLKRARYSGRNECSYHTDTFDMIGWNYYMTNDVAARGLLLMAGMYNPDGTKKHFPDLSLPYPDLSVHAAYKQKKWH